MQTVAKYLVNVRTRILTLFVRLWVNKFVSFQVVTIVLSFLISVCLWSGSVCICTRNVWNDEWEEKCLVVNAFQNILRVVRKSKRIIMEIPKIFLVLNSFFKNSLNVLGNQLLKHKFYHWFTSPKSSIFIRFFIWPMILWR